MEREDNRIFLHSCCAPCVEWPLSVLSEEGFDVTLFYYNPNIHPRFEWNRRLDNIRKLGSMKGVEVVIKEGYEEDKWINEEWIEKFESRCHMCYDMRMQMTAEEAKNHGFSAFTTTLLESIYQDHEAIVKAAERAADRVGVSFVYRDFRDGFRKGQEMAKEDGLYRQKYCGCILSLEESKFRDKIYAGFPDDSTTPGNAG